MLKAERHAKIVQIVRERGFVENEELAKLFGVTSTTIRRDIKILNEQNLVHLDHGGLTVLDYLGEFIEPQYETKMYLNKEKKKAVAKATIECINDGETIILDSGTTSFLIARQLKHAQFKKITVITCDLKVAGELCSNENIDVVVLGGMLRRSYYSIYGSFAENILKQVKADKVFLGIDAASIGFGITNSVVEELPIKQQSISISDEVFIIADSTKFGWDAPYRVCSWNEINHVITDVGISEEFISFFSNTSIDLKIVVPNKE